MLDPELIAGNAPSFTTCTVRDERRSRDRIEPGIALHRASAIEARSRHGLCVIKNLSTSGAMLQTQFELVIDETMVLIMANGTRVAGTVVWIRSDLVGIRFSDSTPLSLMLDRDYSRRRMPRVEIILPALMTDAHGVRVVTTCDISAAGTRIRCGQPIKEGPIKIELPNYPALSARILWSVNDQAGCVFDRPFTIDELTSWLRTVESGEAG